MAHAKGTYLGGIRTPADLLLRSNVDEDTGCWRWKGRCQKGTPFMTLTIDGHERNTSGRRAALILSGSLPKDGQVAYPSDRCAFHDCVRPKCARWGSVSERMQYVARLGKFNDPGRLARLAAYNETRRKVSDEQVLEILLSEENGVELAKRMPVGPRQISYIRNRTATRPAISIFEWRP